MRPGLVRLLISTMYYYEVVGKKRRDTADATRMPSLQRIRHLRRGQGNESRCRIPCWVPHGNKDRAKASGGRAQLIGTCGLRWEREVGRWLLSHVGRQRERNVGSTAAAGEMLGSHLPDTPGLIRHRVRIRIHGWLVPLPDGTRALEQFRVPTLSTEWNLTTRGLQVPRQIFRAKKAWRGRKAEEACTESY